MSSTPSTAASLDQPLPLLDLREHRKRMEQARITDEQVRATAALARRVRASTDRAVFLTDHCGAGIGIGGHSGIGIFPIICKLEPGYVHELHEIAIERAVFNVRALLPEVRDSVDVIMTTADDWGTQNTLIASPATFRDLFLPYYRRLNDEIHGLAPGMKVYMHNCGAIYDILDMISDSGFDVLNPVQWPAGGHSYAEWKDRVGGRLAFWGGGLDTQHTLPYASADAVRREVREVVACMKQGGGYVFTNIHNLLAETSADKVVAMYGAASEA
jgi:uroporphyrinogen decarboxylase